MDGERNLKAKIPEEPGENPEMSLVHAKPHIQESSIWSVQNVVF